MHLRPISRILSSSILHQEPCCWTAGAAARSHNPPQTRRQTDSRCRAQMTPRTRKRLLHRPKVCGSQRSPWWPASKHGSAHKNGFLIFFVGRTFWEAVALHSGTAFHEPGLPRTQHAVDNHSHCVSSAGLRRRGNCSGTTASVITSLHTNHLSPPP